MSDEQKEYEGHIFKRYDGELSHLHYLVLEMGDLVASSRRPSRHVLIGQ
jgi:hypothetical protein